MRKFTCIKDFIIEGHIGTRALVLKVGDVCLIEFDRLRLSGGFILKTLPDINGKSCDPWYIVMMFLKEHFSCRSTTIKKIKENIKKLKDEKIYLY